MRSIISLTALVLLGCGPGNGNNNNNTGGNGSNDLSVSMMAPDMAMSCDAVKQDCAAGQKCVPNMVGGNVIASGTCVKNGTVTEGQPCVQDPASNVLNDNCAAGLSCDNDGADGSFVCRKLCTSDTSCTIAGQKCVGVFDPNPWGLCLPTCTLFGNDCPSGSNCAVAFSTPGDGNAATGFFVCKTPGPIAAFGSCMVDTDCGANLVCDGTHNWCTPVCDANHACNQQPAGADGGGLITCQPFPNLTNGQGTCG